MRTNAVESEHTCPRPNRGPFVNGVRIDPLTRERFLRRVQEFLECGRSHVVHFVPADPTVLALDDSRYRTLLNSGDLNIADGMSVVWASRLLGSHTERVPGVEAMSLLAGDGISRSLRHYLFGSRPTVVEQLSKQMTLRFPGIALAGAESPPFRPFSDGELVTSVKKIRDSGTQLLWIGMGTPKQDLVAERMRIHKAAPVILCVGAAFDFLAGSKSRAPSWMRDTGLEWLYRLIQEPKRLWARYLIGNTRFVTNVGLKLIRSRLDTHGRGQ